MLELLLCSMLTILPDFLYRRFWQGKRLGQEITIYSVFFELRWGIVGCLMLIVGLITTVFYNHPASANVVSFFRTVPIVPEGLGRVASIEVGLSDHVDVGQVLFRLDDTSQRTALETARRRVAEVDAAIVVAQADLLAADGQIQQAQGQYDQALDELQTKQDLYKRNPDVVPRRELERLQNLADARQGGVTAALAAKQSVQTRISTLLPAQKDSAEGALQQAQVALDKTVVHAGVSGRVEQFALQVGDIVNPLARPAGLLIPDGSGRQKLQAGFGQIEAQVMEVGMVAEAVCISKPWTVIPMVVTSVQDYIAAGQFRGGEQLIEARQIAQPGTILVTLEPMFEGGLDGVTPGSSCIANAYSSNHERIVDPRTGSFERLVLHGVDAVGLVHAMLLRIQAVLLPFQTLVFGGH
jgi:multidrug resistance efflux pump